jgi:hypothetical protein
MDGSETVALCSRLRQIEANIHSMLQLGGRFETM